MKKRKYITEQVLQLNEQTTNSDAILFFECLRFEFRGIKVEDTGDALLFKIPKEVFKKISSPESYRRVRQKFNAEGKYLPTNPHVLERRKRKEVTKRRYFGRLKESGE